jgi:WXG100 family type VII secretion target
MLSTSTDVKGRIISMSGNISIPPEQLESVSAQLSNAASTFESTLGQVRSQVEAVSGVWQGMASSEFQNLMAKWNQDVQDLHEVLTQIAMNLTKTAETFRQADTGSAKGFTIS